MAAKVFLAVDLRASSSRVVAGLLQDGRLQLDELHLFQNGPVRAGSTLYWDLLGLWRQVQAGLRKAAAKYTVPSPSSLGTYSLNAQIITVSNQITYLYHEVS